MNKLILSAVAGIAIAAVPASAAVIVNTTTDKVTLSGTGGTWKVNYNGLVSGNPVGTINSRIEFALGAVSGTSATINYQIFNTSTTAARLSVFGFRVNGGATLVPNGPNVSTSTAPSSVVLTGNDTLPGLNAKPINICFKAVGQGNNCNNGSQNSGVLAGKRSALGTITLRFQNAVTQFEMDNFVVRYQSLSTNPDSGVGIGELAIVPEPASWAMMIGGFGLIGMAARRRRVSVAAIA